MASRPVEAGASEGAGDDRAPRRRRRTVPGSRSVGDILRANLLTRFNAILGALLVVVAVVGPVQDGLFGVVLVTNAAIGIVQELRAKRTLDRLSILNAPRARVVRDGVAGAVDVEDVVAGDTILLQPGDQLVTDGVVARATLLEVDESLVTGESEPVPKQQGDPVVSGSYVVSGDGTMTATSAGADSYASRLATEARRFVRSRSELLDGTNAILRLVTWVMVPTAVALLLTQLLRSHQSSADAVRGSVAGVAAMVPEGLVLLTSLAFAAAAVRLGRRHVLVGQLAAVEGLARVDVVCLDKTGTLAAPGLRLQHVEPLSEATAEEVAGVLAFVAAADPAPNATMRALAGEVPPALRRAVAARVPFSSARKWSAVSPEGGGAWLVGAPEILAPGDPAVRAALAEVGASCQRWILLAHARGAVAEAQLPAPRQPVALVGLSEQLRPDAARTVRYLQEQGVTLKVLSGDEPGAVDRMARRSGIPVPEPALDVSSLTDDELDRAVSASNVLGRIRPEQKRAVVRALQERGHVVAMIGDGVNDIPALKAADLAVAMGTGTEATRAVAGVVLLDSAFSALPAVLGEGRRVIANIERVARLFVTKTVYAALLAVVVAVSAVPFPFFPRHLTVVSTFTIGVPAFLLAFARGAPRARAGFVPRVLRFAVPAGVLAGAATFFVYATARLTDGTSATEARTAAMVTLFALGLWVLLLVARPLRPSRLVLTLAMAAGLVPVFAVGRLRQVLGVALPHLDVLMEAVVAVAAVVVMLAAWFRSTARHRRAGGGPEQGARR